MPVELLEMTDEDSKRIGVKTPHGLVLIRFYEDGSILVGHTDPWQMHLEPSPGELRISWEKGRTR